MSSYVSAALRQLVAERAEYLCEYCLLHEEDTFFGCEVDHIISKKHGGPTVAENLVYACAFCNRAKGSDVESIVRRTGTFSRFFNPRIDRWAELLRWTVSRSSHCRTLGRSQHAFWTSTTRTGCWSGRRFTGSGDIPVPPPSCA
jgi:hypothetical protein